MQKTNKLLRIQILKEGLYLGTLLLIVYLFGFEKNFNLLSFFIIYLVSFVIVYIGIRNKIKYKRFKDHPKKIFSFEPLEFIWSPLKIFLLVAITLGSYFLFGFRISLLVIVFTMLIMAIIQVYFQNKKRNKKIIS